MHALRLVQFGGPEALQWVEVSVPEIGPTDVLIKVAFCGVCRHDLLTRSGAFPSLALPVTPGHQISGVVVQTGAGVTGLDKDQRVITLSYVGCGECDECRAGNQARCQRRRPRFLGDELDGGYAEYVTVPAAITVPVPDAVSLDQAAVITCTLGTAYHALSSRAAVQPGETVVITGASGGVGIHAIKLAKLLDTHVIGITSSEAKERAVRAAGADEVVVAPDSKFSRPVKSLTAGRGADAVIDVVGGPTLAQSIHAIRDGGRVVIVGNVEGGTAEIQPALFILKEIAVMGTKSCTRNELEHVLSLVADGHISIEVEGRVPLREGKEIHRLMESGASQGRLVLEVAGEGRGVHD
jgi:acryloyl-coenzyme A reductase